MFARYGYAAINLDIFKARLDAQDIGDAAKIQAFKVWLAAGFSILVTCRKNDDELQKPVGSRWGF